MAGSPRIPPQDPPKANALKTTLTPWLPVELPGFRAIHPHWRYRQARSCVTDQSFQRAPTQFPLPMNLLCMHTY